MKVWNSAREAVADIPDGASIMIGGWAYSGIPRALIMALRDRPVKGLTLILNGPGTGRFFDSNILIENKQVKTVLCSITFPGTAVDRASQAGEIEVVLVPQGTLAERIRAGGFGIGGFYTPTGVGTIVGAGKEERSIEGRKYILELPLRADYALIRAYKADRLGNLVYRGVMSNFNAVMATAAKITIAEVEKIVETEELDPNAIITPQIFVDRIVEVSREEEERLKCGK